MQMVAVVVRAAMMTTIRVAVQNGQDDEVTNKSKYTGNEHVKRLLNLILLNHSMRCFNEEFYSHNVDKGYIKQGSQSLSF